MAKPNVPKLNAPKAPAPKVTAPKVTAPKVSPPAVSASKLNPPKMQPPKVPANKINTPHVKPPAMKAPPGGRGGQPTNLSRGQRMKYGGIAAAGIAFPVAGFLAPTAQKSGYYQDAAKALQMQRHAAAQATLKALMPARSALVKQKTAVDKNVASPLLKQLAKAKDQAKSNSTSDLSKLKAATAPAKAVAGKNASALKQVAELRKKQAAKALMPTRSALVKQKNLADARVKPGLMQELAKAKSLGQSVKAQDAAKIKKVSDPLKAGASKEAKMLKSVASLQKKQALKALMPAKSALVKQKLVLTRDLAPVKSTIGRDIGGLKKGLGQVKTAAQKSSALQTAKKQEVTKKRSLERLLRMPQT